MIFFLTLLFLCNCTNLSFPDKSSEDRYLISNGATKESNIYSNTFENLLLIIHFNHPYYSNIDFLKELYSPFFKNIVFYGEKQHKDVLSVFTHQGYYLSTVLNDALNRFPDYEGYLVLQDDCILNYWNFISLDRTKFWYATKFNKEDKMDITPISTALSDPWGWRKKDNILNTQTRIDATEFAYSKLSYNDKNVLEMNLGKSNTSKSPADFFYIPQKHRKSVLRLSGVFQEVFCEIAIPNMIYCLEPVENLEELRMVWGLGSEWSGYGEISDQGYPRDVHWVHPLKLSNKANRDLISNIFNEMLTKNYENN